MSQDFTEFFQKYENLATEVDAVFGKIKSAHGDCVTCSVGCSDCCQALFDLTLIEALYLNHKFNERYSGDERSQILMRADDADRKTYLIKKQAFKASQEGRNADEILAEVATKRVRCPLLNDQDQCDLYEHRPLTCRLYGIPTAIGGKAHTCGQTGFEKGKAYPTVNIEKIQDRLVLLSRDLAKAIGTKHVFLHEVLVPVSMALMNDYNEEYLGLPVEQTVTVDASKAPTWSAGGGRSGGGR